MKLLLKRIKIFILSQENILLRLSLFRMIFAGLLIFVIITEDSKFRYLFYFDNYYFKTSAWYAPYFDYWKGFNLFLVAVYFTGYFHQLTKILVAASMLPYLYYLDHHLVQVTEPIWFYSAYLPTFIIAQLFCKTDAYSWRLKPLSQTPLDSEMSPRPSDAFFLFFFQIYVINMFFQSAISKIFISSFAWFIEGRFIRIHTLISGTPLGIYITGHPLVFKAIGWMTFLFEFFGVIIYWVRPSFYGIAAIIFHLSTWIIMDINFIFMWPIYLPIFFKWKKLKEYISV